jgi:hypothetical protein
MFAHTPEAYTIGCNRKSPADMLLPSLGLLAIAAVIGAALALLHLRPGASPAWPIGALHGALAALGYLALFPALQGPPRGVALGVGSFSRIAAALLGLALLTGLGILGARLTRRRLPGLLLGTHATLAICGVVVLAAYALVG